MVLTPLQWSADSVCLWLLVVLLGGLHGSGGDLMKVEALILTGSILLIAIGVAYFVVPRLVREEACWRFLGCSQSP